MDFDKFNEIASTVAFLPNKRIEDLQNHVDYHVTKVRPSKTVYGLKIVVEIDDSYKIYLPPRSSDALLGNPSLLGKYQMIAAADRLGIKFLDVKKSLFVFVTK